MRGWEQGRPYIDFLFVFFVFLPVLSAESTMVVVNLCSFFKVSLELLTVSLINGLLAVKMDGHNLEELHFMQIMFIFI